MLYAYSFQLDAGPPRRGEIKADSGLEASRLASARHAGEGDTVVIRSVFEAPPRHGTRVLDAPELPRINFKHSLYERPLRRQARA